MRKQPFKELYLLSQRFVALHQLFFSVYASAEYLDIAENKLKIYSLYISSCAYVAVNMNDVVVLKAADYMNDSVHLSYIRKKFVSESLAVGSALYKSGYVHKFERRRSELFGLVHLRKLVQSFVRYRNYTHIWF